MANSPQARKRARQQIARRARNIAQRSALRTAVKKFLKLVVPGAATEDAERAAAYRRATVVIDRAAGRGLHHKNRAARLKKRLNNRLRAARG